MQSYRLDQRVLGAQGVDEIADINQSEKLMMTLWNRHLDTYSGLGARHMDTILLVLLKKESPTIISRNYFELCGSHHVLTRG